MPKNYRAYMLLVLATLFWSGNFIVGKFAYLFQVPPLTLNVLRWISVWLILMPFTYNEIKNNLPSIKKNWFVISIMGVITISTFNSVVYFALNFTKVINSVLVLAAIPAATIIFSSIMKIEKTNVFQLLGLFLSIIGIGSIISYGDIQNIIELNFNKGDLWMIVCVITGPFIQHYLKNINLNFHSLH